MNKDLGVLVAESTQRGWENAWEVIHERALYPHVRLALTVEHARLYLDAMHRQPNALRIGAILLNPFIKFDDQPGSKRTGDGSAGQEVVRIVGRLPEEVGRIAIIGGGRYTLARYGITPEFVRQYAPNVTLFDQTKSELYEIPGILDSIQP